MRASHLATALTAFAAGLSAAAVLHRLAELRTAVAAAPATVPAAAAPAPTQPATPDLDGIVLPFLRTVPTSPAAAVDKPARCGDTGGTTKAGAPCAARATTSGRCHHHRVAA